MYPDEISTLLHQVEKYTEDVGIQPSQRVKYIEQNGWRTRMGGRGLQNGGNRVVEKIDDDKIAFGFTRETYMLNAPAGEIYEKNDLIFLLGDDYSKSTRDNAVTALLETFRHSPIGTVLKQGIPIPNGNSYKFSKQGWNTPDAVAILYALYMWAEATGRYTFTLGQMAAARGNAEAKGVDPVSIFGINPDRFKDILQDISLQFDKYIRTTFVADLDNVQLFPEYKSLDILDLIAK